MSDSPPNTITLTVPGMGSDHCAGIVRKTLERLDGVQKHHQEREAQPCKSHGALRPSGRSVQL